MSKKRKSKYYRLNHYDTNVSIGLFDGPDEVKIIGSLKSFISVKESGITLSGGFPSKINIQGMSGSIHYAGMIGDLPFPLSIMPTTPFNPFPKQVIKPPLKELLGTIRTLSQISMMLVG